MKNNVRLAIIGRSNRVNLFNTLGFKSVISDNVDAIDKIVFQLVQDHYEIIFIDEVLYKQITATRAKYAYMPYPIFIPLPLEDEKQNIGMDQIYQNVEKAVGFNIFRKDE